MRSPRCRVPGCRPSRRRVGASLGRMQDIGVGAARVTAVSRSENTPRIFLELRGVRDTPHASDKDGETGADEDALETLQRLSAFWRQHHPV